MQNRIKELREKRGISQEELANEVKNYFSTRGMNLKNFRVE